VNAFKVGFPVFILSRRLVTQFVFDTLFDNLIVLIRLKFLCCSLRSILIEMYIEIGTFEGALGMAASFVQR
jgi:hypothetical protein